CARRDYYGSSSYFDYW
nr:immunoglobulin heavy chain junction region [Mus musculus]